jgi:tRNA(Ile)-lysidine synthetase-like protein
MKINQKNFNKNINTNFLFEKYPNIAVAVSGGPDSLALAILLSKWIKIKKGNLVALIIDHKIRPESSMEAKYVKNILSKHMISSIILNVSKNDVLKKNMNEARSNRFNKLINFCIKNFYFHLFVAHHLDDNIETFLIRKIAGSNIEGLRSIQSKVCINGVRILRPLLDFNKLEILEYLKKNKIQFVIDPSNFNTKYSRIVVRNFLNKKKLYKKQIENDFKKIKKFYPMYKKMIFQIFNTICMKISSKNITIDCQKLLKNEEEVQSRMIEIIYKFLKPNRNFLRGKKIKNSLKLINSKDKIATNLGGMIIKKDTFSIIFSN